MCVFIIYRIMVKKGSKRGLNTGNTIRQHGKGSALRQYQKYGCVVVTSDVGEFDTSATKKVINDLGTTISVKGGSGVEFSLNKQKRWKLPESLKHKINTEQDSTDIQVNVVIMPAF